MEKAENKPKTSSSIESDKPGSFCYEKPGPSGYKER